MTAEKMVLIATLVLTAAVVNVEGFSSYVLRIPNGGRVPNPCVPGGVWTAVGHTSAAGGGPRNAFGVAFEANNNLWTRALCQADSDGDGVSNGAELGDPSCSWTLGAPVGHPGICEPLDSPLCQSNPSPCGPNGLGWEAQVDGDSKPASQEKEGKGWANDDHRSWHSWGHKGHSGGWGSWGHWGHHDEHDEHHH